MRTYTIDNHGGYHFTLTNTFADTQLGEKRRICKVFSFTDYMYPEREGAKWQQRQLIEWYGKDRGTAIYRHPKLSTKMKWGAGVLSRAVMKKSGDNYYPVYRVRWQEYNRITGQHEKYQEIRLSMHKLTERERRIELHEIGLQAAVIRANQSLSELDLGVLDLEFDLEAMPEHFYG